ncbi:uncharacterized protein NDAI_0A05930 [Naumovozyma dairenensis CBS 421]|uniref:Uncharacterized protein n=1 Tax=Naumovozyma dairenensis (strain ATCC 10597 / BCRC 20456 / CBS 421 / NBRC 0211 / NRRL Y-12639) TaxID=1071378 RepID=G0W4L0_NAUDC|nr:hypothetical protein NDAI_0A05930 [Naumovozyma dairenensis CBS 421]CCD22748.1 hypothetical protein NDAI_0A05930 [Naumovozyma dairenensis CBS 421]
MTTSDTITRLWPKTLQTKYGSILHSILSFITFTILGNYARAGVTALATYQPSYVSSGSVLWSNLTGCIIMGILQELTVAPGWFPLELQPLFVALTTGFCGSFTSYSSMMLELFKHSTNTAMESSSSHWKNHAYSMLEFMSVLFVQLLVSMASLIFGRKLATDVIIRYGSVETERPSTDEDKEMDPEAEMINATEPRPSVKTILLWTDILSYLLAVPLLILIIVLASYYGNYSRAKWTLPPLFGIFGSFLRFWLANQYNGKSIHFPWGTFIGNVFSTLLIAILTMVQRGKLHANAIIPIVHGKNACLIVSALINGFCGSLSTISTFINEGYKLSFEDTMIYYFISIFVSYCCIVITLGSYAWSKGLVSPVC